MECGPVIDHSVGVAHTPQDPFGSSRILGPQTGWVVGSKNRRETTGRSCFLRGRRVRLPPGGEGPQGALTFKESRKEM